MARTLTIVAVFLLALCTSVFFWISQFDFSYGAFTSFAELEARRNKEVFTSLYFVGDIMLGRSVEKLTDKNGDDYPFQAITFASSSLVVGNFEAVVPVVHEPTPDFHYNFSVPTSSLPALKEAGFTHLGLANNHSYDFGAADFRNTQKTLQEAGFIVGGDQVETATTSLNFMEVKDQTIALIYIYALDRKLDEETLESIFSSAAVADQQIVFVHWGTEYTTKPNSQQRELAKLFVAHGADFVIGHHPHVVQSVELIDNTPVFYSLGNFIFDQYFSNSVQEGLVLRLEHNTSHNWQIELLPVTSIGQLSQPRYMTNEERKKFLNELAANSEIDLQEHILTGTIPLFEYAK